MELLLIYSNDWWNIGMVDELQKVSGNKEYY